MKSALSEVTYIWTSSGSKGCNSSTTSRTASEIASVLPFACRMMPRPMPVCPFARRTDAPGSGPSVACATSPSRTPPEMVSASICSVVRMAAVVRT